MTDSQSVAGLSPLDQIRLVEAEITRKIIAAREISDRALAEARARVMLIKKQALESGTRDGRIHFKEAISKAEEEARAMVEHAHNQAADLRQNGQTRMEAAIQEATGIVLGLKGGEGSNEP